jgi:hypothetical protein
LVLARTDVEAKRAAQGLVDHFNSVLNRTISESRLSALIEAGATPPHFDLLRRVAGVVTPIELNVTSRVLMFQQKIEVLDGHCQTLTYSYRLQRTIDHRSWLCRWEYFRKPPKPDYPYPLAHVHVNAAQLEVREDGEIEFGANIGDKHFPTERVAFEHILLHLIEEWGVRPLSTDYREILADSLHGFGERRTDR